MTEIPLPPHQPTSREQFNPLAMEHLAESIGNALLASPTIRADQMQLFLGAGVYAIYYVGSARPYQRLAEVNAKIDENSIGWPIYVGKAVPEGGRRGLNLPVETTRLYGRLHQHRRSLTQAEDFDVEDFYFRWLVVEPIWIPLGESILIRKFQPVWNAVLDGFGNHAPGGGRVKSELSPWDTLHTGRNSIPRGETETVYWRDVYAPNPKTPDELAVLVCDHLSATVPQRN